MLHQFSLLPGPEAGLDHQVPDQLLLLHLRDELLVHVENAFLGPDRRPTQPPHHEHPVIRLDDVAHLSAQIDQNPSLQNKAEVLALELERLLD